MADLPDIGEVLAPLLARVPRERQPLLVALAERLAAGRYRGWAEEVESGEARRVLLACAEREEAIAGRIEGLFEDASGQQRALRAALPEIDAVNRSLFAGLALAEQWTLQARGERLGAATWRAFAAESSADARATFEACAALEEENAAALERLLAAQVGPA